MIDAALVAAEEEVAFAIAVFATERYLGRGASHIRRR